MTSENSFFIQLFLSVPSFCSFYVLANFSNIFSWSLPLQKPWSLQSLLAFPLFLIFWVSKALSGIWVRSVNLFHSQTHISFPSACSPKKSMVSSRGKTWGTTKFSIEFGQWNPPLKHSLKSYPSSPFPQILPSQSPALLLIWLKITHLVLYLPKVIQPVFLPIYPPTLYTSCKISA